MAPGDQDTCPAPDQASDPKPRDSCRSADQSEDAAPRAGSGNPLSSNQSADEWLGPEPDESSASAGNSYQSADPNPRDSGRSSIGTDRPMRTSLQSLESWEGLRSSVQRARRASQNGMEGARRASQKVGEDTYRASQRLSAIGLELNDVAGVGESQPQSSAGAPDYDSVNYARYEVNERRLKVKVVAYLLGAWASWPWYSHFLIYLSTISVRGIDIMSPMHILVGTTVARLGQITTHMLIKRCYKGFMRRKAILLSLAGCAVGLTVMCAFVVEDPNVIGMLTLCQMLCSSTLLLICITVTPFQDITKHRARWFSIGRFFSDPVISVQVMLMENVHLSCVFLIFVLVIAAFVSLREGDLLLTQPKAEDASGSDVGGGSRRGGAADDDGDEAGQQEAGVSSGGPAGAGNVDRSPRATPAVAVQGGQEQISSKDLRHPMKIGLLCTMAPSYTIASAVFNVVMPVRLTAVWGFSPSAVSLILSAQGAIVAMVFLRPPRFLPTRLQALVIMPPLTAGIVLVLALLSSVHYVVWIVSFSLCHTLLARSHLEFVPAVTSIYSGEEVDYFIGLMSIGIILFECVSKGCYYYLAVTAGDVVAAVTFSALPMLVWLVLIIPSYHEVREIIRLQSQKAGPKPSEKSQQDKADPVDLS